MEGSKNKLVDEGDIVVEVRKQALEIAGVADIRELAASLIMKSLKSRMRIRDAESIRASYRERFGSDPSPVILVFV